MLKIENISSKLEVPLKKGEKQIFHLLVRGQMTGKNKQKVEDAIKKTVKDASNFILLLDFENLHYVSRTSIALLFRVSKELAESKGQISITNVAPQIAEAFEIAGLLPGVGSNPIFTTAKEASQYLMRLEKGKESKKFKNDKKKTLVLKP